MSQIVLVLLRNWKNGQDAINMHVNHHLKLCCTLNIHSRCRQVCGLVISRGCVDSAVSLMYFSALLHVGHRYHWQVWLCKQALDLDQHSNSYWAIIVYVLFLTTTTLCHSLLVYFVGNSNRNEAYLYFDMFIGYNIFKLDTSEIHSD